MLTKSGAIAFVIVSILACLFIGWLSIFKYPYSQYNNGKRLQEIERKLNSMEKR